MPRHHVRVLSPPVAGAVPAALAVAAPPAVGVALDELQCGLRGRVLNVVEVADARDGDHVAVASAWAAPEPDRVHVEEPMVFAEAGQVHRVGLVGHHEPGFATHHAPPFGVKRTQSSATSVGLISTGTGRPACWYSPAIRSDSRPAGIVIITRVRAFASTTAISTPSPSCAGRASR